MQPVVILVHGATLNGASWAPVRRSLEAAGLTVIAPDLPGHGARSDEVYTLEEAVRTVAAAAQSVAPRPVVLAGDSLGSYTSQATASHLPPGQLKGLVLGGSSHEFIGAPTWPYRLKALGFRVLFSIVDERKMVEKKIPAVLREFGLNQQDTEATMKARVHMSAFPQAVASLCGTDFKAMLARIDVPVMFINGDDDTYHVKGEAAYVAAAKDATVHRFAGCDHGVSLRRSSEYAELVKQFVRRVGG